MCVSVCATVRELRNETTFEQHIRHGGSLTHSRLSSKVEIRGQSSRPGLGLRFG